MVDERKSKGVLHMTQILKLPTSWQNSMLVHLRSHVNVAMSEPPNICVYISARCIGFSITLGHVKFDRTNENTAVTAFNCT